MDTRPTTLLIKDRHLPWDGPFPYDDLAAHLRACNATPIDPASTAQQIRDSFFDVMAAGRSVAEARAAWEVLRQLDERLIIDFFLYEAPAGDVDQLLDALSAYEVPAMLPDFRDLADVPPDRSVLHAPEHIDLGPDPGPLPIPPSALELPPVDIGAVEVDLLAILEDDDDEQ
jgi:hypothetical protein